jgi:hypothetical protein
MRAGILTTEGECLVMFVVVPAILGYLLAVLLEKRRERGGKGGDVKG